MSEIADLHARIAANLMRQGLMRHLHVQLERVAKGAVELSMPYGEHVTQQQGSFHAGAMSALADAAGGCAGLSVAPADMDIVAVEFKINFLRARRGGSLLATAKVIKPGRQLIVTQVDVMHRADDGQHSLCASMQQTLIPVTPNP